MTNKEERRMMKAEIIPEIREKSRQKPKGRKLQGEHWFQEQCPDPDPIPEKLGGIQDLNSETGPNGVDTMWLIFCGALVMLMQMGFGMIECGTVRISSAHHILIKNFMDICIGTIMWFLIGFGFAYGYTETLQHAAEGCYNMVAEHGNAFIGTTFFASSNVFHYCEPDQALWSEYLKTVPVGATVSRSMYEPEFCPSSPMPTVTELNLKDWFFQNQFCATAATIVSGGIAERLSIEGYVIFSFFMTGIIYPVVVAWTWSVPGWGLTAFSSTYYDFAGSGIVHMVGGVAALIGAYCIGPRKGRWEAEDRFKPHSIPLVALGTFTLWFGWYGFNCGSTLGMSDGATAFKAALAAVNTSLAGSAGGLTVLLWDLIHKKYDLPKMCNGILSGLVAITAGCANVEPYMAIVIGVLGGILYMLTSALVKRMRIDDVLDAFAVHGANGFLGALCAVIFDLAKGDNFHGWGGPLYKDLGYALGVQVLVLVAIIGWTSAWSILIFVGLRRGKFVQEVRDGSAYQPNFTDFSFMLQNENGKSNLSHEDGEAMIRILKKLMGDDEELVVMGDSNVAEVRSPKSPYSPTSMGSRHKPLSENLEMESAESFKKDTTTVNQTMI